MNIRSLSIVGMFLFAQACGAENFPAEILDNEKYPSGTSIPINLAEREDIAFEVKVKKSGNYSPVLFNFEPGGFDFLMFASVPHPNTATTIIGGGCGGAGAVGPESVHACVIEELKSLKKGDLVTIEIGNGSSTIEADFILVHWDKLSEYGWELCLGEEEICRIRDEL